MCQVCPRRIVRTIVLVPDACTTMQKFSYAEVLYGDCGEIISGRYVGQPWFSPAGITARLSPRLAQT